jgi:diguanylate cyclase (GGDEF)-like protein
VLSLILCCASVAGFASAQKAVASHGVSGATLERLSELNFESMGMQQGLPHDSVYAVTQDSRGYLWIATFGGLARYDGYSFRTYIHQAEAKGSLPDDNVRAVVPGKDGRLWVGTGSAGLSLYDPNTDSFTSPAETPRLLRKARIFGMAPDAADGVWVGTQLGLAHYMPASHRFEVFGKASAAPNKNGFPSGSIFCVLEDREHNLWFGGEAGLFVRYAGTSQFVQIHSAEGDDQLSDHAAIWSIFEDHAGEIWIGSDVTGIGIVDRATGTMQGVAQLAGKSALPGPHTIRGFVEAEPGHLWVATYGGGLLQIDRAQGTARLWTRDPTAMAPLRNNFIRGIFLDRSGVLWLGTDDGLSRTNVGARGIFNIHSSPLRPDALFGSEVRSVGAGFGRVWVGFDQGGFADIEPDGSIHRIAPAPGVKGDWLSQREVLAIKPADADTVIAGGVGLYRIDVRTYTYRPIEDPILRKQIVNALCVDGDELWIGGYDGLIQYNRRTRAVRVFARNVDDPKSLADNYVRDILKRSDGKLWITTRLGLDLFDPATGTFQHIRHNDGDPHSLGSDNIQPIAEDAQGRLWIGTIGSGLTILESYDAQGKPRFRQLDRKDGLPNGVVLTVTRGKDGTMWANTADGLAAIDPRSFHVVTYGSAEGLQTTSQNLFSSVTLDDGGILFPGNEGLIIVRPKLLKPSLLQGPLVLTELGVSGSSESPALLAHEALARGVRLASHHGFTATFADLDYTSPSSTRYAYKLAGFDRDWTISSGTQRNATYTNLPPGRYHLLVRASTANPEAGQTLDVPIYVAPRFYETRWFAGLCVLVGIGLIFYLIRFRTARLARRQRQLEEQIASRTAELKNSQLELVEANKRLSELADSDFLTGALNRRGFFERAAIEMSRHTRKGHPFCVLLVDLDDFKQINDAYGHTIGDAALRLVAQVLGANLRPTDMLARYGGEEFIILLPETTGQFALPLADRLLKVVESVRLFHDSRPIPLTASIGVASLAAGFDLNGAIVIADRYLYEAKKAGKNCVRPSAASL